MVLLKHFTQCHLEILRACIHQNPLVRSSIMAYPKKACGSNCAQKCGKSGGSGVDPSVLAKLEDGFQKLCASNSGSLLKKHLTKEVFDKLKNKKTSFGSTLLDCVQSGKHRCNSCFVALCIPMSLW